MTYASDAAYKKLGSMRLFGGLREKQLSRKPILLMRMQCKIRTTLHGNARMRVVPALRRCPFNIWTASELYFENAIPIRAPSLLSVTSAQFLRRLILPAPRYISCLLTLVRNQNLPSLLPTVPPRVGPTGIVLAVTKVSLPPALDALHLLPIRWPPLLGFLELDECAVECSPVREFS
jgi:hypothetical protein